MNISVYILVLLSLLLTFVIANEETVVNENTKRRKHHFYCSACHSMCETIHREMNSVDPNERVQVGSFRVDGHGHQKLKDVPIVETSYHAENVLENVCSKSIRFAVIPADLRNLHEHACDDILEEYHDSLIDLLITENKNTQTARQLAQLFCVDKTQYCQNDELEELYRPTPTPPIEEEEEEEEKTTDEDGNDEL